MILMNPSLLCAFFNSKNKRYQTFLCHMGSVGKFEHVVYDKGRHFYLLSPQISFKCVSVFPHSAVSVKKTMSMSSLIREVRG